MRFEEQETVITGSAADDVMTVWTNRRRHITELRKKPGFTEVRSGWHGKTEWAEFTIPSDDWSPATGARRRVNLSDEQRRIRSARFKAMVAGVETT